MKRLYSVVVSQIPPRSTDVLWVDHVNSTIKIFDEEAGEWVSSVPLFIEVTWQELKDMRDKGQLVPGMKYRITDFVTAVVSSDNTAKSAGHPFDLVVEAISNNALKEEASALQHEGDTYFNPSTLEGWKVWYCLDNDTTRFEWADTTNGKGVIYRLIDEWGNDCPYDFKNVQFKRWAITDGYSSFKYSYSNSYRLAYKNSDISAGATRQLCTLTVDASNSDWYYTFSLILNSTTIADDSVVGPTMEKNTEAAVATSNNVIKSYIVADVHKLNNIVFANHLYNGNKHIGGCNNYFSENSYNVSILGSGENNRFYSICKNSIFGESPINNKAFGILNNILAGTWVKNNCLNGNVNNCFFGYAFQSSILHGMGDCTWGSLGSSSASIVSCYFGDGIAEMVSGDQFSGNIIGNHVKLCTFGNNFLWNKIGSGIKWGSNTGVGVQAGSDCYDNVIGDSCSSIVLGNGCNNNTFGQNCTNITLNNQCHSNTFGNGCTFITLGEYNRYNVFENYCRYIGIGSKENDSLTTKSYMSKIKVESGVENVYITCSGTTSSSTYGQNILIHSGVKGTDSINRKIAAIDTAGNNFLTEFGEVQQGTLS